SAAATASQGQQTYQVVRVPQYSSATLGSATSSYWNGSTGGIVAYDVAGNLNLTGGINVNGKGFRGGGGRLLGGAVSPNTDYRTSSTIDKNGSKAEGIAGTPRFVINPINLALVDNGAEGYPNGSYGRGAPGNAGGGSTDGNSNGNDENSGGGGGSNGGAGGIGGRSWSSNLPTGGFGGKPFSATTSRLVLGGGGGAGTTNNGSFSPPNTDTSSSGIYSSGASGGGMVMLRTNTVSGTGTISANGSSARDVTRDGGGAGGAGGSVLVSALSNNVTGLTVNVVGGNGGSALFSASHGPGGGGGGGVVVSSAGVTTNLQGGIAGVTGITSNPNNGAVAGTGLAVPISVGTVPGASSGAACVPALAVVKTTSTPTVNRGSQATYKIVVSNGAGLATANNVTIADNSLPAGFTLAASPAPTINLINGSTRPTTSNPTAGTSNLSWGTFSIPGGGSVEIQFTVDVSSSAATGTYNNPASATYTDPATSGSKTVSYDITNTGEDVTVTIPSSPQLLLVKRITKVTRGGVAISPTGSDNFNIFNNDGTAANTNTNWPVNYLKGANNGGAVAPGDVLEYTIYFLSAGNVGVTNVNICDLVPANTTFFTGTYNGLTPLDTGSSGGNLGIALASGSTTPTVYMSSVSDGDRGTFYAAGTAPTSGCVKNVAGTYSAITNSDNTNGLVVVNVAKFPATIPNATGSGTPSNSYGFVRFNVTVN
ncbi:DUF11 domain-containing protein, partial [Pseudanabaena sp. 'Roaring Creek']|uniref:beta strand repeat-containing protein n=1 Tax=Pseudanabaena sp. 'Roaring Creek' TaxID=1681830 RepID=UPI0006D8476C